MSNDQILSWAVTVIGITGFFLAGRKVWWCWYLNIFCQVLWYAYAYFSETPAFYIAASFYSIVFGLNAYKWSKEHFESKNIRKGQYRTKSTPVDALYFEGGFDNADTILDWLHSYHISAWWKEPAASYVNDDGRYLKAMPETIRILDKEGTIDLWPGEYAVVIDGRPYSFPADAFESIYEKVK